MRALLLSSLLFALTSPAIAGQFEDGVSAYEAEEDRITVVADEDGDGRADKSWVFADGFRSALTGTGAVCWFVVTTCTTPVFLASGDFAMKIRMRLPKIGK